MKKYFVWKIILLSVLFAFLANILFGRFIAVKLSTLPVLSSFNILSPQAPIVINTREEIRVNETGDAVRILNLAKSKVSSVVLKRRGNLEFLGTAVNLTSDGLFLTTVSVIEKYKVGNLLVKLNNGEYGEVLKIIKDPATELVVLKTEIQEPSVAEFDDSEKLEAGEELIMIKTGLDNNFVRFNNVFIEKQEADLEGKEYSSDHSSRSFVISEIVRGYPGSVLLNNENKVVGIWDGSKVIPSNIMKLLTRKVLSNGGKISRPSFGFLYKPLNFVEEKNLNLSNKVKIVEIKPSSPASLARLKIGDIIISVDGSGITQENSLEELLESFNVGDKVAFKIMRKDKVLNLELEVGSLK